MNSQSAYPPPHPIIEQDDENEEVEVIDSSVASPQEEYNLMMLFDGQQASVEVLQQARQDHLQRLSDQILTQQPKYNDLIRNSILS